MARLDDKNLLVLGGTVAVHVLLLVVIDAGGQIARERPDPPAPRIEMFEIDVTPPPPPPEPPPPEPKAEEPPPPEPPKARVAVKQDVPKETVRRQPVDPVPPPAPDPNAKPDPGGTPVMTLGDITPTARGVAVRQGTPTTGKPGRGGDGGGTGTGSGAGGGEVPKPMSVATIKKRAMPKGDYSFDAAKDYPPAAKAAGIEGQIKVRLLVDASGKVAERRLLNKLGHGLDELALARAAKFEFDPALDTDDRPVASVVVWTFTFTLPS
jgi:protein TonB